MISVHEEPAAIQREFGRTVERCEFCRQPTRFWDATKRHAVCERCAEEKSPEDLKEPT